MTDEKLKQFLIEYEGANFSLFFMSFPKGIYANMILRKINKKVNRYNKLQEDKKKFQKLTFKK